jgi:hypothetical protein
VHRSPSGVLSHRWSWGSTQRSLEGSKSSRLNRAEPFLTSAAWSRSGRKRRPKAKGIHDLSSNRCSEHHRVRGQFAFGSSIGSRLIADLREPSQATGGADLPCRNSAASAAVGGDLLLAPKAAFALRPLAHALRLREHPLPVQGWAEGREPKPCRPAARSMSFSVAASAAFATTRLNSASHRAPPAAFAASTVVPRFFNGLAGKTTEIASAILCGPSVTSPYRLFSCARPQVAESSPTQRGFHVRKRSRVRSRVLGRPYPIRFGSFKCRYACNDMDGFARSTGWPSRRPC